MAIKLGEYLCFLPLLPKPEQPKEETSSDPEKQKDATGVTSVTTPVTEAGLKVNTILESNSPKITNPLATLTAADDRMNIPDRIKIFTSHEISSIEGHPVIALTDICKKLLYNLPQYACVKEEKVGEAFEVVNI